MFIGCFDLNYISDTPFFPPYFPIPQPPAISSTHPSAQNSDGSPRQVLQIVTPVINTSGEELLEAKIVENTKPRTRRIYEWLKTSYSNEEANAIYKHMLTKRNINTIVRAKEGAVTNKEAKACDCCAVPLIKRLHRGPKVGKHICQACHKHFSSYINQKKFDVKEPN